MGSTFSIPCDPRLESMNRTLRTGELRLPRTFERMGLSEILCYGMQSQTAESRCYSQQQTAKMDRKHHTGSFPGGKGIRLAGTTPGA
jgi:hypothetical protein